MIILQKRFTRDDVKSNSWLTYVYGDNDMRSGEGGQALACRGLPNTVGVRTKKAPSLSTDAYYSDSEYTENVRKIGADLDAIQLLLEKHHIVVFPMDGLGTGLAALRRTAPETFIYLNNRLIALREKYRVPEEALDTSVIALNSKAYTVVSNRISQSTIEALKTLTHEHLRGFGVEVGDNMCVHFLVRKIVKRILDENPLNIVDPFGKDSDYDKD